MDERAGHGWMWIWTQLIHTGNRVCNSLLCYAFAIVRLFLLLYHVYLLYFHVVLPSICVYREINAPNVPHVQLEVRARVSRHIYLTQYSRQEIGIPTLKCKSAREVLATHSALLWSTAILSKHNDMSETARTLTTLGRSHRMRTLG